MPTLNWKDLLSTKRVRELFGGAPSIRATGDAATRSAFDQDYGRALFSTPVRRLQDKAQVFPLEPNDSVRTRLTHSLEVSSIARGLGDRAEHFLSAKDKWVNQNRGSLPTIAATCGLIHDIGNPPFGHAGEAAISTWFEKQIGLFKSFPGSTMEEKTASQFAQDFLYFEGNAQTQRLLSSLQILADQYGLNMTSATLSASLKYVVPSDKRNKGRAESKKHGYFASENELIQRIKDEVRTGDARNPIAFLVEAADDIAYATVDLEDGIKKDCLDWGTLEKRLKRDAKSPLLDAILTATNEKIKPAKLQGKPYEEAMSISFRTNAIIQMSLATTEAFQTNYAAIMAGDYGNSLLKDSKASLLAGTCKEVAAEYVYSAPQTLKLELMGRKIIWDLLDLYWEAAQFIGTEKRWPPFAKKAYELISRNYRQVCADHVESAVNAGFPADYYRMQLITDQVCGMTDTFAVTLHRELTNG
jgi:dGTPase